MAVITVSRQFGAGGLTLSQNIAKKLDYTFIDNELIQLVAEKAQVSKDWVHSVEKEAGGKLHQFINRLMPKGVVGRILDDQRGYIDEDIYIDLLRQIIQQIAAEGNCIILGRGGQYILKDYPDTFHILLIAEREYRLRFIEAKYKLKRQVAEQVIAAEDRRRINLYRKFDKSDYDLPGHYHLTLNMSKLSLDTATQLVSQLIDARQQ